MRQSTARQWLLPALETHAANLDVVVGAHVSRVLLDEVSETPRAMGVEVTLQ